MTRKKFWWPVVLAAICLSLSLVGCKAKTEEMHISITNKDALTALWTEGDADRTVAVAFSPDTYTADNTPVVVSSDNTAAVRADGLKLIAAGGGTATVTVTAGEATDSVTITVQPRKTGLLITNKDGLSQVWFVGDADRTVEAAFTTTQQSVPVQSIEVTSSDTDVVEADGSVLKARGLGSCVISVSADGFTDTVEITVRPQLTGLSVANKDDLQADWTLGQTRTLSVTYEPAEYYNAQNTVPDVVCEPADILESDGYTLTAKAAGEATVTVTVRGRTDTFAVNVVYGAPVVTLTGGYGFTETPDGGTLSVTEDTAAALPVCTAVTTDGRDISEQVAVTYPDEATVDGLGKITLPKGEHAVTYTVSDPRDGTKTTVRTLTVNAYRKIFAGSDNTWTFTQAADGEQTASTANTGFTYAQFNVAPGKQYYAEVTYKVTNPHGNINTGLAHFTGIGTQDRFLIGTVDRGSIETQRNHKTGDFRTSGDGSWTLDENNGHTTMLFSYRLAAYRGLSDPDAGTVTYAIARVGDFFYQFVNGQYVNGVTLDYYTQRDTIPGIFGYELNTSTVTDIVYLSGADAQAKLDRVFKNGAGAISAYAPYDWASASLESDLFTVGETTADKGVNYTFDNDTRGFNDGMVSPWLYFESDFTFSWDYKNTSYGAAGKRMFLEVRPWNFTNEIVQFGAEYGADNDRRFLLNVPGFAEGDKWVEGQRGFDDSQGARFTISRRLTDEYSEYTMTATSLADPTQTMTRTMQWKEENGTYTDAQWNKPVLLLWHNWGVAGEYTNITWSASAPPVSAE